MWLHVPTECCPTVPASADWSSESVSLDQALAASATLRGKSLPPRSWRRVCETGRFTRLLSGLTSPPSTDAHGVASWIASLRETPASPTPSPESSSARTTTAGSSTTSSGSSPKFGLIVSSARTSQGTRTDSSPPSSQHWKAWVTALRLESSQRAKPRPTTSANDSSSWPTATAHDARRPGPDLTSTQGGNLCREAATWATPQAHDVAIGNPKRVGRYGTKHGGRNLTDDVTVWPTPSAEAFEPLDIQRMLARRERVKAETGNGNGFGLSIGQAVALWETPSVAVTDGSRLTRGGARSDEKLLTGQAIDVSTWPTPAARDFKGGGTAVTRADGKSRLDMLDWRAEAFSRQAPPIRSGARSLDARRISLRLWLMSMSQPPSSLSRWVRKVTRRKLNPSFVDWMHGWPSEWTDCERAVTGFRPWLLQSRGALSRILSRPTSDGQLSMFD